MDVVILATGEPHFDGAILNELFNLVDSGTIRVLDAMIIVKDAEGNATTRDIEDLPADQREALGFIETGTRGLFDTSDADTLIEGLVPGSAVVALAIENAWAVPLLNSFEAAGAELALHTRIPAVLVEDALAGTSAGA